MDLGRLSELANRRVCPDCGAVFETDGDGMALAKYADHSVIHQPDGAQWKRAYEMIQASKPKKSGDAQ